MGSIGRLIVVHKNKSFIIPAVIFALNSIPFLGYIAVSSYIYVDHFELSAEVYSYFFAATPWFLYLALSYILSFLSNMNKKVFASILLGVSTLSGTGNDCRNPCSDIVLDVICINVIVE
jgi:DHA1 family bicyclomycin/chloramphenicol resistance-like MFS transporter